MLSSSASVVVAPAVSLIDTDALIIGAGPVGLFQVFQLGLQALHAEVVDVLPHAGGQCVALYADKPIYDIPGLPVCTGQELTDRLMTQIRPFAPGFHWGQQVSRLEVRQDGRFELHTQSGTGFRARTVFIAAGVGAFVPRSLKLPGLDVFRGTQVVEGGWSAQTMAKLQAPDRRWVVVGNDDTALTCALQGVAEGRQVTLIHRREHFSAEPRLLQVFESARSEKRLEFMAGQPIGFTADDAQRRLSHLKIATPEGQTQSVALDTLWVCLGLLPQLGVLSEWGLAMARRQLTVDPVTCETSVPGIFAVGDVNTYPGKKKLILCGFHEATQAAYRAVEFLDPSKAPGPLLYTTSSAKLHRLLGVDN